MESSVSCLRVVNSIITVFSGYLCGHYILWEAAVHFQILCNDRLLWRSKELAIQGYGVCVCDVDSPACGNTHIVSGRFSSQQLSFLTLPYIQLPSLSQEMACVRERDKRL